MAKSEIKKIAFSSAKMGAATFLSRILGLARELSLAAVFGAGATTDAFTVAYRIPNMLRDLLAEGSLSSAFVPVFIKELIKDERSAKGLLWSLFALLLVTTAAVSACIIYNAKSIVLFMTGTLFAREPDKLHTAIVLTQLTAPFLCLVSLSALLMGVLNSLKLFFLPALAPVLFNIAMILSIVFLADLFKSQGIEPAYALGWGVLAGGLLHFLLQLSLVLAKGYGPKDALGTFSQAPLSVLKNLGIGTIGVAATQINILVTTILATGTQIGAVSWLSYAFRLFQFPIGILGVSIAGSNLVHFSDAWKAGDKKRAANILASGYTLCLMTLLPALALIYSLAEPMVKLVFERGRFDPQDTLKTAEALRMYSLGLPFYGLYKIFGPTFFALEKAKIPVFISIACIVCNIVFCTLAVPSYGYAVLALGTSLSIILNASIQIGFLKKYLHIPLSLFINAKIVQISVAAILCFYGTDYLSKAIVDSSSPFWLFFSQFCLASLGGVGIYGALLLILKIPKI